MQNYKDKLILILRLTDDYLIISESKELTEKIIDDLFKIALKYNFEFNKPK